MLGVCDGFIGEPGPHSHLILMAMRESLRVASGLYTVCHRDQTLFGGQFFTLHLSQRHVTQR